jgi:putative aldouronate transport system permease protein
LLNEIRNVRFKRTVQTIIYLPHFVSWVIYGGLVISFLSLQTGVINKVLTALFDMDPIFFLAKKSLFRPILVVSHILKESGWVSIIYIAAITGINPELYEAAIIGGANRFKQTLYVTLPGISATIVVMLILSISNILNVGFQQVVVLYNPLVYDVGDIIDTYVFRAGIKQGRFSYTTAVGFFKSVVALILILSCDKISKKITDKGII